MERYEPLEAARRSAREQRMGTTKEAHTGISARRSCRRHLIGSSVQESSACSVRTIPSVAILTRDCDLEIASATSDVGSSRIARC
jgi:hypothetical protein